MLEDDRRIASILRQALAEAGHAVQLCHRGDDGLNLLVAERFDLAVLDLMLPGLDGFGVLQHLRGRHNETPVLVLTARDASADTVRGLDLGADDYLTKPFQLDVLLARVRALTRRGSRDTEKNLVFGTLALDRTERVLRREGNTVALTRKEFLLLDVLMRRPNRVVTRAELIEAGWGLAADVSDSNVDFYISSLRGKVDTAGEPSRIRTLRALGYSFSAELQADSGRHAA